MNKRNAVGIRRNKGSDHAGGNRGLMSVRNIDGIALVLLRRFAGAIDEQGPIARGIHALDGIIGNDGRPRIGFQIELIDTQRVRLHEEIAGLWRVRAGMELDGRIGNDLRDVPGGIVDGHVVPRHIVRSRGIVGGESEMPAIDPKGTRADDAERGLLR